MKLDVKLLPEAKADLLDIYNYVAKHDSSPKAWALIERLEEKCISLGTHAERGHAVPELSRIYVCGFLEIHFKPYRIIYQIMNERVYVHAILDGRREIQEIMERRVLR